jgi:hypothetical protein
MLIFRFGFSISKTKFFMKMGDGIGFFDIEAKIGGITVGKIKLVLDELLDLKERNKQFLELEHITLNVQGTVFLLNKLFLS